MEGEQATTPQNANGRHDGKSVIRREHPTNTTVETQEVTELDETSATFSGQLVDRGSADTVSCSFEWRTVGTSAWTATDPESLDASGRFVIRVIDIESDTEHECRAVAEAFGDEIVGSPVEFATDTDESSEPPKVDESPVIDGFDVDEDSPPNPHGGNNRLESATTTANGAESAGSDTFKISHGAGDTYRIELTVVDDAGGMTTAERTLSTSRR